MRFDVYGLYQLEVARVGESWRLYRLDSGKRRPVTDFAIPATMPADEIAAYLDDMLHEIARPGRKITTIG